MHIRNEENHTESINRENENVNNEEISLSDEDPETDEPRRQKSHIPYKFQNRRLLQVAVELTDFKFKELSIQNAKGNIWKVAGRIER